MDSVVTQGRVSDGDDGSVTDDKDRYIVSQLNCGTYIIYSASGGRGSSGRTTDIDIIKSQ